MWPLLLGNVFHILKMSQELSSQRCQNIVQEWSYVRRILCACENTLSKDESCDLSFVKMWHCTWKFFFMFLPGVADRNDFTSV